MGECWQVPLEGPRHTWTGRAPQEGSGDRLAECPSFAQAGRAHVALGGPVASAALTSGSLMLRTPDYIPWENC